METELTNWTMLELSENEPSDLRDTRSSKKLTVCTFSSPWLINEANYLAWESTHTAAAPPAWILLPSLLGQPQKRTAQSLLWNINIKLNQFVFLVCGMKLDAHSMKWYCSLSAFQANNSEGGID